MVQLIAMAYPTQEEAQRAADAVSAARKDDGLVVEDMSLVEKDAEGHLKIGHSIPVPGIAITGGLAGGALIGALLGGPIGAVAGAAIGGTGGAISGNLQETGIDDDMMRNFASQMPDGATALFIMLPEGAVHTATQVLSPYGGKVLHTTLPRTEEREVRREVE